MLALIQKKTQKIYEMYRPGGVVSSDTTCWRCGFMADRLIDLLIYEGLAAKRKNVKISAQGHVCVEVTLGDKVVTADPSVEQFSGHTGVVCVEGTHPADEGF